MTPALWRLSARVSWFGTDRMQMLHVICYDAVDDSEGIDDDLFLFFLPLFVVALNGTLDSFRGRGVIFLAFSYVNICKLKRVFYIL